MAGTRKVAALDGLRVIAIAAVVVYHANPTWLPGGYLGVSVFFVLTGYLITLSIEREISRTGRLDYPRFLWRRVTRLLPSMLAVVGVTTVLCALLSPALLPKVKADAVPALLFVENLTYIFRNVSYFAAAGLPSPLTHLWFVGVIMQFYVVWPLLLVALSKLTRSRSQACAAVAVLTLASALAMALLYDPTADTARIYYGPDTRAAEFLVGALCALATRGHGWQPRMLVAPGARGGQADGERPAPKVPAWTFDAAAGASVVAVAAMTFTFDGYSAFAYRGGMLLVSLLTAVVVGVVCRPQGGVAQRVLGWGPLAAAGQRAFALYLWHYPLLLVMNPATRTTELPWWGWALEAVVVLAVAEASWRLLEAPAPQQGRLAEALRPVLAGQSRPTLALEAVGLVAALAVTLAPISAEQTGVPTDQQQAAQQAAPQGADAAGFDLSGTYLEGTAFGDALETIGRLNYAVNQSTGATDAKVLLVGDSVPAGAVGQFRSIFPDGYIDAQVGRQLTACPDVYDQAIASGYDPQIVVWASGDNGVAREGQVRDLIEMCGDRKVYLVTVRVPQALQDINNRLFHQLADEYDNVEVIDWYAESAGHPEYFWDDGTHLRPEGAKAYVMMLRRAITGQ